MASMTYNTFTSRWSHWLVSSVAALWSKLRKYRLNTKRKSLWDQDGSMTSSFSLAAVSELEDRKLIVSKMYSLMCLLNPVSWPLFFKKDAKTTIMAPTTPKNRKCIVQSMNIRKSYPSVHNLGMMGAGPFPCFHLPLFSILSSSLTLSMTNEAIPIELR